MYPAKKQKLCIRKYKQTKIIILFSQLFLTLILIIGWEVLSQKGIINSFIYSSPSKIIMTIRSLIETHNLWPHILTTLYEVLIAFMLGTILGFIISIIFYIYPIISKILDPFLTILNSLPKVALGPIIIIIAGANTKSIILMALLINLIISITTIYNGFIAIDETKIKLFKSYQATKLQTLKYLIIPSSYQFIISSLKINISMTLIGVITGEFLVSQKGIGYLIIYGTQVFNLNLVMSGIFILLIISFIIYKLVIVLEKRLCHK
jgi:NitT/TauT family transport system permease protein